MCNRDKCKYHIPVERCINQLSRRHCFTQLETFIAMSLAGQMKGSILKRYTLTLSCRFEPHIIAFTAGIRVCEKLGAIESYGSCSMGWSSVGKGTCGGSFRFYKCKMEWRFRRIQISSFWAPRLLVWRTALRNDRSSMRYLCPDQATVLFIYSETKRSYSLHLARPCLELLTMFSTKHLHDKETAC